MGNKEKYCKVLEEVLGNKLGGTKYKELGSNLGPAVASYLKEKFNEKRFAEEQEKLYNKQVKT